MKNLNNSFLAPITQQHRKITLIGMSGLGKSYWSKILADDGYKRFCCDDLIADGILTSCSSPEGKIDCLGQWMGMPMEPDYKAKERAYLTAEQDILAQIADYLERSPKEEKVVVDTTGSAPYAGDEVMQRLKASSYVLHLAISADAIEYMLNKYIQSPRPVLWGDLYQHRKGESVHSALKRSYHELLHFRESLYQRYSHHSVPYELHRI